MAAVYAAAYYQPLDAQDKSREEICRSESKHFSVEGESKLIWTFFFQIPLILPLSPLVYMQNPEAPFPRQLTEKEEFTAILKKFKAQ